MKFLYLLTFVLISINASAQILTFEFSGLAGNEASDVSNFNNPDISASTITRGSGLTASNNGGRFNATSWATTSIANAVSGNNYMEFTITPNASCDYSVTSIDVQLQRSSTGPREIALRSSADGYTANLGGAQNITDNTSTQNFTFTFAQNNIAVATTYRLYMWAESTGGSGGFGDGAGNDIIVNGSTSCSTNTITLTTLSTAPFATDCGSGVGTNGSIAFTSTGTFNVGNLYSAELSDAAGVFGAPIVIGTLASTANSGLINFTLPSSTVSGTNYLIRIVSSSPSITSNSSTAFTINQANPCGLTTGIVATAPFSVNCLTATTDAGTVAFNSVATMLAGNVYTVEISNTLGDFTAPTTIGTLTSTANSGNIPITIPSGLSTASNYRVRITSSAPPMSGDSSAFFTVTQMQPCVPSLPSSSGLIINEFSNGPSGNQEYYEFVVSGQCGDLVDIRGFILDDNNGTFTTPSAYAASTSSGIAPGHFRFSNDVQWANIPVGSLIVVFNQNDPNPSLPLTDPNDANNDSLYVVPHNNALFERCTTMPNSASPDSVYTPCTYSTAPLNGWSPLSLKNGGDAIQVRSPNGDYFHGISYGGSEMTGGPDDLKLFTGSGSGQTGYFSDGDFYDINQWTQGTAPANETPGLPNNAANLAWLRLMRDPLSPVCPVVVLPVELNSFTGIRQLEGNLLNWITLSERNASHFMLERSIDGVHWEQINYQNAIGNTLTESSYSFVDRYFIKGKVNYYRLNQTDFNGINTIFREYVAIDNTEMRDKSLVKIVNVLGQEIDEDEKGVQLYIYEDGTIVRIFKM